MSLLKSVYKVFRSIIMSVIMLLVIVYVGLYVVLSVPSVQNRVREFVCVEASKLTGGEIKIENLNVSPFSEVRMKGVSLASPEGERCAGIDILAAGIDLWALMSDGKIVLNYAEIIGLDVNIEQPEENSPLNIQFLIDALSPKDKDKPSAVFDLRIRNVVVRDSKASFRRKWLKDASGMHGILADIEVDRLRMDLNIPVISNDRYAFDIRNIQFEVTPGVSVRSMSAHVFFTKGNSEGGSDRLVVKDFHVGLPNTSLSVGDLDLQLNSLDDIHAIVDGDLTPSDFKTLIPELDAFQDPLSVAVDATLKGKSILVTDLTLCENRSNSTVILKGDVRNYTSKDSLDLTLEEFKADISPIILAESIGFIPKISNKGKEVVKTAGRIVLDMEGYLLNGDTGEAKGELQTDNGSLGFSASVSALHTKRPRIKLDVDAIDVDFGEFLATDKVGKASMKLEADLTGVDRNMSGSINLSSDECVLLGNRLTALDLELNKKDHNIDVILNASADGLNVEADGKAVSNGKDSKLDMDLMVSGFNPSAFGVKGKAPVSEVSGVLKVNVTGNSVNNMTGLMEMRDADIRRTDGRRLKLSNLIVRIDTLENEAAIATVVQKRDINISCDWLDGRIKGRVIPATIVKELKNMVGTVLPTLMSSHKAISGTTPAENDFSFEFNIKGEGAPYAFFDCPVRPLTNIPIYGNIDGPGGKANLRLSTPHMQQGKNKLIRDISMSADLDSYLGMAKMNVGMIYPAKKGDAEIAAEIEAVRDKVDVNIGINPTIESSVKGWMALTASFSRLPDPFRTQGELAVDVEIHPSAITVNDKTWNMSKGTMDYSGKRISISNFLLSHDSQYVRIDGVASESQDDQLKVKLNDIDLEYIFNILNINYVSFGGMATGEVTGSCLLTKSPIARTEFLRVRGLSYNGAVLGDGDLASEYDARRQMVGIYAVIRDPLSRQRRVSVDGGIWVTRDSLSFGFDADRVNVGIMKPFVSAFCSDLYGSASGKCKLFGTFSDIDLVGDLKADTLSMKLDFTNTWYHAGNDSVFLHNGLIDIPPLTLYDDHGHTAEFSGWLRHTYFHEPVFSFRLRDARSLLCYDTNAQINPLWYGTIYGSGHAQINGRPGLIDIDMNMTTDEGSKFYYIISDAEDIAQYSFLTFTDKRKQQKEAASIDTVPEYLKKFRKESEASAEGSSNVVLSLKGTVTNDALVTLVMDPKAGDNITARGQGALQMDYDLANNDLRMIGTYILDEGNYNFTLQDIIIKNFNIRKGSLIKFNGDPMNANLDITATYRVNTNLTDLDESFAHDKELNRTNVPVDAVLQVDGPMTNPDISFDIELPSLTSDVERKVKSIVSTNDMMSRQIIYLLAMNRFYTPEYTNNGQGSGSEWSSLASSTISSQLSNILSQMTDKLDVAPSFRSDKGDFTDMEFDLALSSRLLNNRLLINGNFGYRDKSTSNTQFIGDFDIEYLLSKNGNLRLKAYNHFNDQNYYLRSSLTTQGVGVVFRRDFDRLFRRRKTGKEENDESMYRRDAAPDSLSMEKGNDMIKIDDNY